MATTRIISMHVSHGKTIADCLTDRIDYSKNPDKTQGGELISAYECDPKTADAEFLYSKRQYQTITGREQRHDVIAYQVRQSFKPGEITPEEANRVGYEFAERFLKGRHAFFVATHTDKKHIHNHIIWNSTTLDCKHKFRDFLGSGRAVARLSDAICTEHRLSVIADPKRGKNHYGKWLGDNAKPTHNSLLHLYNYRKLKICTMEETEIVLAGSILINRSAKGFQLCKEYSVKIVIPIESEKLPYVLDAGNHIDCNYPHRYLNGKLCLETDTSIRVRFVDGFSLEAWLEEFVEPYYFSYEFYQRYGEFPFGERGHDWKGIIQTYSDYFNEPDVVKTIRLMAFISDKKYRGHILCPCGSGRRLRSCHGPFIMKYCVDNRLRKIVRDDYLLLQEMVRKNDKQQ